MKKYIIYNKDTGIPAIITPSEEALQKYGLMAIAEKDVPEGKPFKFMSEDEFPTDWPQETWEIADSELTDGVGSSITSF